MQLLSGMVGVLTGITRIPFTSAILVIEMTNTHNVIIDLMLTALLTNLVANIISKYSFYDVLKDQYTEEVENIDEPKKNIKT